MLPPIVYTVPVAFVKQVEVLVHCTIEEQKSISHNNNIKIIIITLFSFGAKHSYVAIKYNEANLSTV